MAKAKKISKQIQKTPPFWNRGWSDLDRVFDNFKKDFERSFTFPNISMPQMPKLNDVSCDVVDEGKEFVVKMDVPGVKKQEIDLNVTDNSVEVSAKHKEESEKRKKTFLEKNAMKSLITEPFHFLIRFMQIKQKRH